MHILILIIIINTLNFSSGSKPNENNIHEKKVGSTFRKKLTHQASVTSDIERHLHGSSSESLGPIGGMYWVKFFFTSVYPLIQPGHKVWNKMLKYLVI